MSKGFVTMYVEPCKGLLKNKYRGCMEAEGRTVKTEWFKTCDEACNAIMSMHDVYLNVEVGGVMYG